VHELDWHPLQIIGASTASVETVLKPAGLDASKGLVTTQFLKQPGDPPGSMTTKSAPTRRPREYARQSNPDDYSVLVVYERQCADDGVEEMRRSAHAENLLRQAHRCMANGSADVPDVTISTTPEGLHAVQRRCVSHLRRNKLELNGGPVVGRMKRTNDCFRPEAEPLAPA